MYFFTIGMAGVVRGFNNTFSTAFQALDINRALGRLYSYQAPTLT